MGEETKSKKRKAAAPDDEVAKVKKVKQMAAYILPQKRKAANDPLANSIKKSKGSKSNLLEDAQSTKNYPTKVKSATIDGDNAGLRKPKSSSDVKALKNKLTETQLNIEVSNRQPKIEKPNSTKTAPVNHDGNDIDATNTDDSEEDEIDIQRATLLDGFESDDDGENDPDNQGYDIGDEIPTVDKKIKKKAQEAAEKSSSSDRPGVVYVGRIPHGFYEQEMRQYFSQFGNISNLRLSRNRKTGKSKHFAFVEFESAEVAEIVSKTMDNYLLFGHILKCKLVAPEQVHKDLWIGANRRFKSVPWNKIQGRKLSQAMLATGWERRVAKEEKRRADKKAAMKLMDYNFESPRLKSTKDILKEKQVLSKPAGAGLDKNSDEEVVDTIIVPKKTESQAVTPKSPKDKKETEGNIGAIDATNGMPEKIEILPTVTTEASMKKKLKKNNSKEPKTSVQHVGVDQVEETESAKDVGTGSAKKIGKSKKIKKNRLGVASG